MRSFLHNLAAALLSGAWSLAVLAERGALACGKRERWLRPLVRRVLAAFPEGRPAPGALRRFLEQDAGLARAWMRHGPRLAEAPRQLFWVSAVMSPAAGRPATWAVPALATDGALAEWLGLAAPALDWFADCHGHEADVPAGPLRHYTYQWRAGRRGKRRLLEMPKQRLKAIQRRLLHEILDHVPPHDAVHGYRRGRSLATYVGPHVGHALVLRFDLRDFFPSIHAGRVNAFFRTAGYPAPVARLLTGLCTNVVPHDVLDAVPRGGLDDVPQPDRQPLRRAHLPQGAPTSAALANLCAYRLDCRLAGLARSVGARYTRYADDLAFSGDERLERSARRFQVAVCRIALEEGFEVHARKTRFMRRSVRQQLCGVIVNARPNVPRAEYDRLKAILYNCIRHGPRAQNRDGRDDFRAYLAGRVAYVAMFHPERGRKLRALFDRIAWQAEPRSGPP
jgi:hypothetical protein